MRFKKGKLYKLKADIEAVQYAKGKKQDLEDEFWYNVHTDKTFMYIGRAGQNRDNAPMFLDPDGNLIFCPFHDRHDDEVYFKRIVEIEE